MTFSSPNCSTFSSSFSDLSAFFSRCSSALLFLMVEDEDEPGSGERTRGGDVLSGELHGVTVGEKF
jgi:hypothetical protein